MPAPRISLVIPAFNEEHYLPRLLDTIDAARARYREGAEAIEVIVADNGSTDAETRQMTPVTRIPVHTRYDSTP